MDNERKEFVYTDSSDVEHKIHLSSKSFEFAQKDKSVHDSKFNTKPTTFLKDAFKRFCKNKSSVAGAIILGILLLGSIIIPIADPYDIERQHPNETFLEPKLFPAGTGFWDGTKRMTDVPVDPETLTAGEDGNMYGYPYSTQYPQNSVLSLSPARQGYVNTITTSATGGFINVINLNQLVAEEDNETVLDSKTAYYQSSAITIDNISEALLYRFEITLLDDVVENYPVGDYGIFVTYDAVEIESGETVSYELTLKDYNETPTYVENTETDAVGNEVHTNTLVIENCLAGISENTEIDLTQQISARFVIRIRPNVNSTSSIFIKSVQLFEGELANPTVSWTDANANGLRGSSDAGYWSSNGTVNLYHGIAWVCDFTFDTYAVPYGNRTQSIAQAQLVEYINNGWLSADLLPFNEETGTYDNSILRDWYRLSLASPNDASAILQPELEKYFTNLSQDYLPIISITSIRSTTSSGITVYTLNCVVSGYKVLGYTSQPIFLLGTDNYGYDMLKRVFTGLLTSLGLGILIFAICFSFGLVYGAICGYFGGNIDIALQRFCDLLSGVPWIVIMTICILNLGSNFGTFILAMCMTGWIGTASLTRTQFYRFRDREYTLASRTLGASNFRLIFKHILPNAMGTIITSAVLMIPSVIFTEATISYLGLGFQDMQSLGVILSDNQTYLNTYAYLILFPSVIMALIMISFNLFGNGLRDAFNPSLKGSD